MSAGRIAYQLVYQVSPIFLKNGLAEIIPGGVLPIVALTERANFTLQALGGTADIDLNSYFAHFDPMPGSTLVANELGRYPFANQQVAANAIIKQPLTLALRMTCPVKGDDGYVARLATMTILQQALEKHNSLGGTYAIATPAYFYNNCILKALRDISPGNPAHAQTVFQWDFEQPLVSAAAAEQANSDFINKLTGGVRP